MLEKSGQPVAKVVALPSAKAADELPPRTLGDFRGQFWIAEDFADLLPDDFWGFDKPLEPGGSSSIRTRSSD